MLSNPEDNREIAKGNLSPLTDWNWSGNIQIPANENGKKLNLTVTSSFNDGKEATATSQFLYQKDFKSTAITGKDWNTLLQNASHSGGINDSQIKLPLQLQWTANTGSNIFMASPLIVGQKYSLPLPMITHRSTPIFVHSTSIPANSYGSSARKTR